LHYLAAKGYRIKYHKPEKGKHDIAMIGVDIKGRRVRVYEKAHHEVAAKEKFGRVRELKREYPKILEHISKDVDAKDETTRENARVAYIIAKTGLRPGTRKDTQGDVKAYGVTTLKKNHVAVSDGDVKFKFTGKKGVPIRLKVHDEKMSKIIRQQKREDGKELFPGTSDATVRNYLYQYGRFKPKDFRTLKATQIAEPLVKKGVKQSEVVKKVAKQLHNTPGVSRSSYVDPRLWGKQK
jgi:DNA topoisomerase-1